MANQPNLLTSPASISSLRHKKYIFRSIAALKRSIMQIPDVKLCSFHAMQPVEVFWNMLTSVVLKHAHIRSLETCSHPISAHTRSLEICSHPFSWNMLTSVLLKHAHTRSLEACSHPFSWNMLTPVLLKHALIRSIVYTRINPDNSIIWRNTAVVVVPVSVQIIVRIMYFSP